MSKIQDDVDPKQRNVPPILSNSPFLITEFLQITSAPNNFDNQKVENLKDLMVIVVSMYV